MMQQIVRSVAVSVLFSMCTYLQNTQRELPPPIKNQLQPAYFLPLACVCGPPLTLPVVPKRVSRRRAW
jgi:hypothetical protein